MSTKRKNSPYYYVVILLVVLFINGAIYIVATVLLHNRSQKLQSEQADLEITLPNIIRQVTVDGVKSLQWFSLTAENSSDAAQQVGAVADSYPEPLPPTKVQVNNTKIGHSTVIHWEPANGQTLTGVEIYRSTAEPDQPLKDMELIATVGLAKGEYLDETVIDNTTYYYALRAYRTVAVGTTGPANSAAAEAATAHYSRVTDIYTVIPTDETAPRGPRWAKVLQYDSQVEIGLTVQWEQVVDADAVSLNIYRSNEPGELGTKIQSVTPDVTELVDTTVEPAVNYFYTVTASDAAGNESSQTLTISRYGNTSPFVASDQAASERIKNGY